MIAAAGGGGRTGTSPGVGHFCRMTPSAKTLAVLMCGAAAAMLLAGCKPGAQQAAAEDAPPPLAALPLTDASEPQGQTGPLAVDLPYASPARVGRLGSDDGYAYLDRAYFLNDAFGDAPPDYAFDYEGEEAPWAWRTDDGFIRIVEPLPYGDRYYYYQPGQDDPFLIRDPDFAYGYAGGELVALYDSSGDLLPPEDLPLHASLAGRELARAQAVFRSAGRDRQSVAMDGWTARRGQITNEIGKWRQQESHQAGWRTYHQAHLGAEQAHWAPERFRREAETVRVDKQIHDPDGAERALRSAGQAQAMARKAHVQIAMLPRGGQGGGGRGGAGAGERLAMAAGAPAPVAERPQHQAIQHAQPERLAAERRAQGRFEVASGGAEVRAQYNVRRRGADHGPAAFDEPHVRAAEQVHAARPNAPPHEQPHVSRAAPAPHVQVAQAEPHAAPHGGGANGGHHGGPPNPGDRDHRR